MKPEALKRLLSLGEGQAVEFKLQANARIVGQQVCAFLNSNGGYLVLGVDGRGRPAGLPGDMSLHELESKIATALAPRALVSFEMQTVEDKEIWVVEVPAGKDIPYSYHGEVFIRESDRTRRADIATLRDMILRRQVEPERWERRFSEADPAQDLDEKEINRSALRGQRAHRGELWVDVLNGPVQVLERLNLMKYGQLTNGGDVLFGKNPAFRHPQVRARVAQRFPWRNVDFPCRASYRAACVSQWGNDPAGDTGCVGADAPRTLPQGLSGSCARVRLNRDDPARQAQQPQSALPPDRPRAATTGLGVATMSVSLKLKLSAPTRLARGGCGRRNLQAADTMAQRSHVTGAWLRQVGPSSAASCQAA